MKDEVARELCNSIKLARRLNHSGVFYRKMARLFPSQRDAWMAKANAAFAHADWWANHARDLQERWP
jgi:G:T-mismatch repair DNA endonuclease (very short patch repair protein)